MRTPLAATARVTTATLLGVGFAAVIGSGTAQAAPEDCTINRDLTGATATCHDVDAPAGREYALIVDCWGLHGVPNSFPLMAVGPYSGSWSGSFSPSGTGSASCVGPWSVGTATGAHVAIYRE
ncbi:hypothetical protein OHB26_25580 [Nocardia sp. NBC_01503]|uniref:hypothetical protein n=1 Tax=Nocardia sp. NBC_01503 TaxID=2975997 RepID=UPI002E7AC3E4|nr:hypothetical protein [Nocardia sp. NBC_01503]WTL30300.1 hypothetical protein OHB26_25580 [Nocardia sp. NBC_01503]